jgi:hypothetical protein
MSLNKKKILPRVVLLSILVVVFLILSMILIEVFTNAFVINLAVIIAVLVPLGLCGLRAFYNWLNLREQQALVKTRSEKIGPDLQQWIESNLPSHLSKAIIYNKLCTEIRQEILPPLPESVTNPNSLPPISNIL